MHDGTTAEQVRQPPAFRGRLRVQREMRVPDGDPVVACETVGTPGTEVAPGSHVVREDFELTVLLHGPSS